MIQQNNEALAAGWIDLKGGPHLPKGGGAGTGFWKGQAGFTSIEEAIKVLEKNFNEHIIYNGLRQGHE